MSVKLRQEKEINVGEVWWVHFPYKDLPREKRRPAIVIDNDTIAILGVYITSQNKDNPYSIELEDWEMTGLSKQSWVRIDLIVRLSEWYFDYKIGNLSERDSKRIMQLVAEYLSGKNHEFSIIAISNNKGQYLQLFDKRWNCWLFPYVRSTDGDNKENVDSFISKLFNQNIDTKYVAVSKHCKYSLSDKVYKIYNHKLYHAILENVPEMFSRGFIHDNIEYKWMSFEEMLGNETITTNNLDVIAFVMSNI